MEKNHVTDTNYYVIYDNIKLNFRAQSAVQKHAMLDAPIRFPDTVT